MPVVSGVYAEIQSSETRVSERMSTAAETVELGPCCPNMAAEIEAAVTGPLRTVAMATAPTPARNCFRMPPLLRMDRNSITVITALIQETSKRQDRSAVHG